MVENFHAAMAEVGGYEDGVSGYPLDTTLIESEYRHDYLRGFARGRAQAAREASEEGSREPSGSHGEASEANDSEEAEVNGEEGTVDDG